MNARTYTDKDNIFTRKLDEKDQKGQDAKHAIILENVLESDFERFLSFLYPTLAFVLFFAVIAHQADNQLVKHT